MTRTHVEQDGTLHVRWGLASAPMPAVVAVCADDAQATLARIEQTLVAIRARASRGSLFERPGLDVAGDLLWDALHGTKDPAQ